MTSMIKVRRVFSVVLTVFMVLLMTSGGTAGAKSDPASELTVYSSERGYLYETTNVNSTKLAKVEIGVKMVLLKSSDRWAKVSLQGETGYIQRIKVATTKPGSDAPLPVKQVPQIKAEVVEVRDVPVPLAENLAAPTPNPQPTGAENYVTLKPGDRGTEVRKLQNRLKSLGWFHSKVGGNYMSLTMQAVTDFQKAAKFPANGIADTETLKLIHSTHAPKRGTALNGTAIPAGGEVREMDWWTSNISSIFARDSYATVTDVETGISFRVYRSGGTNHADVQPETAADTAAMKRAYGGTWSWDRRAIWVSVAGKQYAASMNGMAHGGDTIPANDFGGHFCIHFTNSRTHGKDDVCPKHQAMIQRALEVGNA